MKRLTGRTDIGDSLFDEIAFINPDDAEGLYNLREIAQHGSDELLYEIANRLAEYEDTRLEPEKIVFLKNIVDDAFSHMRELLRAEKDGRLVVLPCKVGDELWSFSTYPAARVYGFTVTDISTLNGRTVLNTLGCGTLWGRDIGKTVFLTREEAEKALEGKR